MTSLPLHRSSESDAKSDLIIPEMSKEYPPASVTSIHVEFTRSRPPIEYTEESWTSWNQRK